MWRISLLDEGVSNITPADSESAMMPKLGSMCITKGFPNNIYECETMSQLIQFYRATMRYPCMSTWCKAITADYFKGCPGLTADCFRHFIKVVEETKMNHMDQQR